MLVVAVLLLAAAAAVFLGPLPLTFGSWRLRYPRVALFLWHGVFLAGLASALASLAWSLTLAVTIDSTSGEHQDWLGPTVIVVAGWIGLASIGGIGALVFSRMEPITSALRQTQEQFNLLAAQAAYRSIRIGRIDVVFIDSDIPAALSFPGERARILVSSRLEDELTPIELRAVIEHERAHVTGRHGLVAQLAQLNRACLPRLLGAREFQRATALLVELIADDAAARVCGAASTASALARLGEIQDSDAMALRARRIAARPPRAARRPAAVSGPASGDEGVRPVG